ncbi:hypothetical protein F8S13_24860 [Chloroflexia bacterium SDU3-3]|nr:hypothetical protein F8S13_24860 [Chloroflexia bacterium SDU3-3]
MVTPLLITPDPNEAYQIANHLMSMGVPTNDIQVAHFSPASDEHTRVGTFSDEDAKEQRVGTFDDADAHDRPKGSYDDTEQHQHTREAPRKGRYDDTEGVESLPHIHRYTSYDAFVEAIRSSGIKKSAIPADSSSACTALFLPAKAPYLAQVEYIFSGKQPGI